MHIKQVLAVCLVANVFVLASLPLVALAGALVGVGTRASNGCTSGHGLCGMSRLSKRSIVATAVFFAVGVATASLVGALA